MACYERGAWLNIILLLYRIATCLANAGSGTYLAVKYYSGPVSLHFYITVGAVALPAFFMLYYNLRDYVKPEAPCYSKLWRILLNLIFLPLNVLPRYFDSFAYSRRYNAATAQKEKSKYLRLIKDEENRIFWHVMWVSFMQSALLLNVQMYIMASGTAPLEDALQYFQYFTIVVSILSQGFTLGRFRSFLHSLDASDHEEDEKFTFLSTGVLSLSHSCEIGARAILYCTCFSAPYWAYFVSAISIILPLLFLQISLHLNTTGTTFRYFTQGGNSVVVDTVRKKLLLLFFTYVSVYSYVHNNGWLPQFLTWRLVFAVVGSLLFLFNYSNGYVNLPFLKPDKFLIIFFALLFSSWMLFAIYHIFRTYLNGLANWLNDIVSQMFEGKADDIEGTLKEILIDGDPRPKRRRNRYRLRERVRSNSLSETSVREHPIRDPSPPTWPKRRQVKKD